MTEGLSFIAIGIILGIIFFILLVRFGEGVTPFLLGAVVIFLGVGIIIRPRFFSYIHSYHFDFTGYSIPLGIFMIAVGVLFIWTTLKKKEDKEKE